MAVTRDLSLKAKLLRRAIFGISGFLALLFIPAGSMNYWQAWAFTGLAFGAGLSVGIYFYKHDPELLASRLLTREPVAAQKCIMILARLLLCVSLFLCGLDYRFGWTNRLVRPVPWWLTLAALAGVVASQFAVFWVIKVNRFASSVVQIAAGQRVIDTGPYAFVRHPMYTGFLAFWLCSPLALASYVALPVFALFIPVIALRLLSEEKILRADLPGYADYCLRTRFRLVPFVW